ncbi:MAG: c-type cytochrome [Cyanobacteria bacterium REEB65]|nr:c-type cytochrome [Cyanobacteria bacterium REEB65]
MRKFLAVALAIAMPVAVPVVLTTGMQAAHAAVKKHPVKAAATGGYDLKDGKNVFVTNCATCHGTLAARKPTLPNAANFFAGKLRLTHGNPALMQKIIAEGGARFGHGASPQMPPWGGTLSAKQIKDVAAFERSLKGK